MGTADDEKKSYVLVIPHITQGHIAPVLRFSKQLARQPGLNVTFVSYETEISHLSAEDPELQNLDRLRLVGIPRPHHVVARSPRASAELLEKSFQPLKEKLIHDQLCGIAGPSCIGCFPHVDPDPLHYLERCRNCNKAAGILVNTFYELEPTVIDMLRRPPGSSPTTKAMKIYPIGPLFPIESGARLTNNSVIQGLEDSQEQCLRWLGSQPDSSVLYICFGTLFRLHGRQITELALGLERCKQRFLWVLPLPKVVPLDTAETAPILESTIDVLPPGFEARVGNLGRIVTGWAPQIQVLAHRSTGGFLTHCGWNSCVEAITLGVPMLGWPISADQHMNCRYLEDELKVAIGINIGVNDIVDQTEVERGVKRLMVGEERKELKGRVEELKVKAEAAFVVGGSSFQTLNDFANEIKNL